MMLSTEISHNELPRRAQRHRKKYGMRAGVTDGEVGLDIVSCGCIV